MFERGDLLLVPFTDLSAAKRRPVLAFTAPDTYGDFVGHAEVRAQRASKHAVRQGGTG
ncbi:MAG: hypothetical protein ACJ8DG_08840 [Microvirga sp.]